MNQLSRYFPWCIVTLAAAGLVIVGVPPKDEADKMHIYEFTQIPIVDGGRVKPIDTLARTNLMILSNKQTFRDEKNNEQPAVKWLLDVMTTQLPAKGTAELYSQVHIDDPEVLKLLGLQPRADSRYSFAEFAQHIPQLRERSERAIRVDRSQRTETDRAVIQLDQQLAVLGALFRWENPKLTPELPLDVLALDLPPRGVAMRDKVFRIENDQVLNLLGLEERPGSFRYSIAEFAKKFDKLDQQAKRVSKIDPKDRDVFDKKIYELRRHLELYLEVAQWRTPLVVPPATANEDWQALSAVVASSRSADQLSPAAQSFGSILRAYTLDDAQMFNREVAAYRTQMAKQMPEATDKAAFEVIYNHFAPFFWCMILYVLAFLLACFAWLGWRQPLNRASFWLLALTFIVHTVALIGRMYLSDRWWVFVTNLYSSAVFIGWAAVLMGLVLETIYRNGIGNIVASVLGFATVLIADHLATDGDTLEMMRAVLDTNWWLRTHVTCVTLGYSSTFVAGILAIVFILLGVLTPALKDKDLFKTLGQMIYGIICFATLFSFVGTVLGGIWADQSWGRFWGWDPKENGALIIVLWNALVLHARWGGIVKQRGMALLAIGGNIVTSWSWFGVNMLGVGLHSYGFMSGAQFWLIAFVFSQLGLIAVGSIPPRYWRSFAT